MKQFKLSIVCCLIFSFAKAQSPCDTIILNDGTTYLGIITAISHRVIKFNNCDFNGIPNITVYRKDVKWVDYEKAYKRVEKQRETKIAVKIKAKEEKLERLVDTTKYLHVGIIPYQFLTRSSGAYIGLDFKNVSLEYRPTYTYATNQGPSEFFPLPYYDNFYFQGINNSLLFYFPMRGRTKIGLMLSYKYWWHGKKSIVNYQSSISSSSDAIYFTEIRSTVMNGFSVGLEFLYNIKTKNPKLDINFFWNASVTFFSAFSHVYSRDYASSGTSGNPNYAMNYPYNEAKNEGYFNVTCGFKFGYKKQLKKH